MENAFNKPVSDILKYFGVSETKGLADSQVVALRQQHGPNCQLQIHLRRVH
jgi:hypothetical protein